MKTKTANADDMGRQDKRYSLLIDDYLGRIKALHADMKRSKAEIERLKVSSRRKLAEIDAALKAC